MGRLASPELRESTKTKTKRATVMVAEIFVEEEMERRLESEGRRPKTRVLEEGCCRWGIVGMATSSTNHVSGSFESDVLVNSLKYRVMIDANHRLSSA